MKNTTIVLLLFLFSCASERMSNFSSGELEGVGLDGKTVKLNEIAADRIALNVYSPTCVPCVKEIPSLNYLHDEFAQKGNVRLFMVVDPEVIGEGGIADAVRIMKEEVQKRNIRLPVLVMRKPFRVAEDWLVTGTPETLLYNTRPLALYYNFIGSISEETSPARIHTDRKVLFVKRMLGY